MDNEQKNIEDKKPELDMDNVMTAKILTGETIVGLHRKDLTKEAGGVYTFFEKPINILSQYHQLPNNEIGTSFMGVPYLICGDNNIVPISSMTIVTISKASEKAKQLFVQTAMIQNREEKQQEKISQKPELVWENPNNPLKSDKKGFLNIVEVDEINPTLN